MTNLNVYLNSFLSEVDCTLVCGTLGYLVLTAQPSVFNTHCGTAFVTPINPGIHQVMPEPAPTAAIFSELVRTHKHEVFLFNKYYSAGRACKKVISKLIQENSTSTFQAILLASLRPQVSKFLLASSPSMLNFKKKKIYKTSIGK